MDVRPLSCLPCSDLEVGSSSYGCSLACVPINNSTNGLVRNQRSESQLLVCIKKQHHRGNRSYCQRRYFLFLPETGFQGMTTAEHDNTALSSCVLVLGTPHDSQREAAKQSQKTKGTAMKPRFRPH